MTVLCATPPYGISFMGKKWDYDVPQVELWKEVLRVLKPGGHALVACGTRTQHRMAVNLEDAGFEIRDIVAWVYGSGFPKSLNIGKSVDKLQGNDREITGVSDSKGIRSGAGNFVGDNYEKQNYDVTKGTSQYEGWGTDLKPAMELWTLCRKPLEEKTVAQNVLKYGTGGINIDESRVEIPEGDNSGWSGSETWNEDSTFTEKGNCTSRNKPSGRFPANLIHDNSEEVRECFPETKPSKSAKRGVQSKGYSAGIEYEKAGTETNTVRGHNDSGGSASRFFYCAKSSKSERNKGTDELEKGNNHSTVKPIALMRYLCKLITPVGGTILDPFTGSGSTGIGAKLEGFNFIGIELDSEYVKIAEARINSYE